MLNLRKNLSRHTLISLLNIMVTVNNPYFINFITSQINPKYSTLDKAKANFLRRV